MIQDADCVTHFLHIAENVRGEQHCGRPTQPSDQIEHFPSPKRIERRGGLVEQHELGISHHRCGNAQSLQHPPGVAPHHPIGRIRQSGVSQYRFDPFAVDGVAAEPQSKLDHLPARQPLVEARCVRKHSHTTAISVDGHVSPAWAPKAGQQAQESGLAGAIRTHQSVDGAARDRQVDSVECHRCPVALREPVSLDHERGSRPISK